MIDFLHRLFFVADSLYDYLPLLILFIFHENKDKFCAQPEALYMNVHERNEQVDQFRDVTKLVPKCKEIYRWKYQKVIGNFIEINNWLAGKLYVSPE